MVLRVLHGLKNRNTQDSRSAEDQAVLTWNEAGYAYVTQDGRIVYYAPGYPNWLLLHRGILLLPQQEYTTLSGWYLYHHPALLPQ